MSRLPDLEPLRSTAAARVTWDQDPSSFGEVSMSLQNHLGRLRRGALSMGAQVRAAIPRRVAQRLRRMTRPPGGVRFGNLRRVVPISRYFGFDRGQPVDRHYIELFLARHAGDVRGRVLEVGLDSYTRQFGGDKVTVRDVLDVTEHNHHATIVDDLVTGERIPSSSFDCVILTQTLQFIYDIQAVARTLYRILRPGGVLLLTVPGISQIESKELQTTWSWSFSRASVRRLLEEQFSSAALEVNSFGNVLAASALLQGLAAEELSRHELESFDPLYPVIVTVRAQKVMVEGSNGRGAELAPGGSLPHPVTVGGRQTVASERPPSSPTVLDPPRE